MNQMMPCPCGQIAVRCKRNSIEPYKGDPNTWFCKSCGVTRSYVEMQTIAEALERKYNIPEGELQHGSW